MRKETFTCDACGVELPRAPDVKVAVQDGSTFVAFDACQSCFDRVVAILDPQSMSRARVRVFAKDGH